MLDSGKTEPSFLKKYPQINPSSASAEFALSDPENNGAWMDGGTFTNRKIDLIAALCDTFKTTPLGTGLIAIKRAVPSTIHHGLATSVPSMELGPPGEHARGHVERSFGTR